VPYGCNAEHSANLSDLFVDSLLLCFETRERGVKNV